MKFTKNIGMVLLAVYLIIDGLLGFGLNLGPFVFLYTLWHSPLESLFSSAGRSATLIWNPTAFSVGRWLTFYFSNSFICDASFGPMRRFFMFEIN